MREKVYEAAGEDPAAPERRVDPHGGSDEEGENRRDERELERRRQPLRHQLPHWPAVLVREPELPADASRTKRANWRRKGSLRPRRSRSSSRSSRVVSWPTMLLIGFADVAEESERDQRHGQHDDHRLEESPEQEGRHSARGPAGSSGRPGPRVAAPERPAAIHGDARRPSSGRAGSAAGQCRGTWLPRGGGGAVRAWPACGPSAYGEGAGVRDEAAAKVREGALKAPSRPGVIAP